MKDLATALAELQELRAKLKGNRSAAETASARLDGLQVEEAEYLNALDALEATVGAHIADIRGASSQTPAKLMGGAENAITGPLDIDDDPSLNEPLRAEIESGPAPIANGDAGVISADQF